MTGTPPHGPTPLSLAVPSWAIDSMHPLVLPYDNPLTVEGVALGRKLFHEKALSGDGSLSCASCHRRELAFSDPRAFPSAFGTRRNGMPLINLVFDHYFFWDARALSLELQAFEPVVAHREMNNSWPAVVERLTRDADYPRMFHAAFGTPGIDSLRTAFALAQFERTLLSFDSRYDRYRYGGDNGALTPDELRGMGLFFGKGRCVDCHTPPLFTDRRVVNIGLDAEPIDRGLAERTGIPWHMGRFKTPTLRNVGVTAPYMHDGRFATLEEVLRFYAHGVRTETVTLDAHMLPWVKGEVLLDAVERADLEAFLRTLTDKAFLGGAPVPAER